MSVPLPQTLDPWRAVKAGLAFAGQVGLDALPRLQQAVLGADGPVTYALSFGRDASGQAVALGQVQGVLHLSCQRCLDVLVWPVDAAIALALVRVAGPSDRLGLAPVEGIADHLDPLTLGDDPIHPLELIEDELLLALPQVPMHPPGGCVAAPDAVAHAVPEVPADDRPNPFAVLATLRRPAQGD